VAAGTRQCDCGFTFAFSDRKHETKADEESQVLSEPVQFSVSGWQMVRHFKKDKPDAPNTLRVTYFVDGNMQTALEEWVCLNHEGFALNKALRWWSEHSDENLVDVAEALETDLVGAAIDIWQRGWVRRPVELTAIQQGRFWRITGRVVGQLDKDLEEEELPF
jgi:DNA repair protein RadD